MLRNDAQWRNGKDHMHQWLKKRPGAPVEEMGNSKNKKKSIKKKLDYMELHLLVWQGKDNGVCGCLVV